MTNSMLEKAARAISREADSFSRPVGFYVEGEALARWEAANPDKDSFTEHGGLDWDLESWKILVRAVITAIREPDEAMVEAGADALDDGETPGVRTAAETCWKAQIDSILKEST